MKGRPSVDAEFLPGSSSDFILKVPNAAGIVEDHRIGEQLGWGGNLFDNNEVLERHAGQEAWWQARLVDEIAIQADWEENVFAAYMAHLRRFALYSLVGQGLRRKEVTKQDIDDMLFHLYSETKQAHQRDRFVHFAWLGYAAELFGGRVAVDRVYEQNPDLYRQWYNVFLDELFAYRRESGEPIWREEANRLRIDGDRSKGLLEAVANGFRSRGFMVRQGAENEKARRTAIGGTLLDDVAKRVREQLNLPVPK